MHGGPGFDYLEVAARPLTILTIIDHHPLAKSNKVIQNVEWTLSSTIITINSIDFDQDLMIYIRGTAPPPPPPLPNRL